MKKEITSKETTVENLKKKLSSRNEIIFSYIHGSFLDNYPFHDIDIAVYVDQEKIISQKAFDYSFQLSLDLSKETGFEIDIQIMNYAPLGFRHSVLKNGILLFSKNEKLRLDLIENISLEYIDFYELSLQYIHDVVS
ncbi:MAG: nucleotidyltransferase domain-containing protein [Candidatus Aminicenantes bacterium]|nr:nucleotidyltransferase domain-containing protein [Candidatus Aminicenantes bacterium]TET69304.1 MAG: nucleotidyltransferase domain-containing protein [Candidatus Aminicenantes bacterium]